jgi:hypothetical protein
MQFSVGYEHAIQLFKPSNAELSLSRPVTGIGTSDSLVAELLLFHCPRKIF